MAERGGFEYHSSVLCSCFRLCLATLKCSKIKGSNAVRVGISGNADFSGFVLICHISATREKGAFCSLFLLLVASRLRSMSHLPIFQGFIEVVPHSVPHGHTDCSIRGRVSDPCRFSRSDKRTDLFHSMGHLNQRCAVLSVVCRVTPLVNRPLVLRGTWQRHQESNLDIRNQNPLRYHYAMSLYSHIKLSYVFLSPFITRIMHIETQP